MREAGWSDLWDSLAKQDLMSGETGEAEMVERWRSLASRLDDGSVQRPDRILDFILAMLTPEMTAVDVGAGVGRWAIPLAERVRAVTAVEPVPGMRTVLEERIAARNAGNVGVEGAPWLESKLPRHDAVLAAYSMYTSPDLAAFARKMEATASRLCAMAMRVPAHDGVLGELSFEIRGTWHDSPNFIVGYNSMLEAGFTPNVWVEPEAVRYFEDGSLEEAAQRVRRHLHLAEGEHDALIMSTLRRKLEPTANGYRWPDYMRAALVWWAPETLKA